MASIERRSQRNGSVSYVVRYRDVTGKQRAKSFSEHVLAARFSNKVEVEIAEGDWIDPRRARVRFGEFHKKWVEAREVSISRAETEASQARVHILPRWGDVPLNKISKLDIKTWIKNLESGVRVKQDQSRPSRVDRRPASPVTKEMVLLQLKMCLGAAVEEGILRSNPAAGVKAPARESKRVTLSDVLDSHEVDLLTKATPDDWKALVFLSAWLGWRWSEAMGIRWRDVDLVNKVVHVGNEVIVESGGKLYVRSQGKTPKARRTIPLPDVALAVFAWHRDRCGGGPSDRRVFLTPACPPAGAHALGGRKGGCTVKGTCVGHTPLRSNFRRVFVKAVNDAGLEGRGITVRQLRHTAATLMLSNGMDVLDVQDRLGHARGSITLDVYGRVLAGRRAASTELLNTAMAESDVAFARDGASAS